MDILIKILQFFLSFTLLVGIHEFGHFIAARLFGIRVDKFYIFFDPWFSLFKFKKGDTEYGVGWLPLGGYCKIAGMVDESMDTEQLKQAPQSWEFRTKPAWQRFVVLIAGVTMNVLLAMAIYTGMCYTWGETYSSNDQIKWGYNFNEAAHRLGFEDGDRFVSIDGQKPDDIMEIVNALVITESDRRVVVNRKGEEITLHLSLDELIAMRQERGYENFMTVRMPFIIDSVTNPSLRTLSRGDEVIAIDGVKEGDFIAYTDYLGQHKDQQVQLTVRRTDSSIDTLSVKVDAAGRLGIIAGNPFTFNVKEYTFWESIPAGIRKTGNVLSSYWGQLKLIVQPKTELYKEVGGFIAIANIFPKTWDWQVFWSMTAFLSIILAVMNLLPIPGLDGGHALFTLWEMITGRKPGDKFLEVAQYVGFVILLMLLILANGNDIYKLFMH